MRILYFYQYFSTPNGSWGTRAYENARHWVALGNDVTIITSVFYKSDLQVKKGRLTYEMNCEGIKVKVVNVLSSNKQSILQRIKGYFFYIAAAIKYAVSYPCDIVIVSSGPLSVGIPGLIAKYLRRKKMVFEVRDLWPEGAIQLGVISNKIVIRFLYWLEKQCYAASSLIVVLSPGMISYIRQKVPSANIISIPNASDIEMFSHPQPLELPDWTIGKFIILYTGNIGETNNSRLLLKSSKLLKQKGISHILFVLIGDGQLKEELILQKNNEQIDNLVILDLMPKNKLVAWVQRANVCIIPLADKPFIDTSSPNKLFEAFAAGKCVIQTTNGWIKEILQTTAAGFSVSPCDEVELVRCVEMLHDNPAILRAAGEASRKLAENFEKSKLAELMINAINKII
jgi:glycosyltransferase involved in cell wall biosynthesis